MIGCLPLLVQMPVLIALYQAIYRTSALKSGSFLWMQLGKADPYFIMAILAAVFTFATSYLTMMSQPTKNATTTAMLWVMPIMIFVMAMNIASAIFNLLGSYKCLFCWSNNGDSKSIEDPSGT